jgi:hypothetical protein
MLGEHANSNNSDMKISLCGLIKRRICVTLFYYDIFFTTFFHGSTNFKVIGMSLIVYSKRHKKPLNETIITSTYTIL